MPLVPMLLLPPLPPLPSFLLSLLLPFICRPSPSQGVDDRVVVEVFAAGGKEFTAIVLESSAAAEAAGNGTRGAVCLIPTQQLALQITCKFSHLPVSCHTPPRQVELTAFASSPATAAAAGSEGADSDSDSSGSGDIFDYRRKYLPTQQVLFQLPCPISSPAFPLSLSLPSSPFSPLPLTLPTRPSLHASSFPSFHPLLSPLLFSFSPPLLAPLVSSPPLLPPPPKRFSTPGRLASPPPSSPPSAPQPRASSPPSPSATAPASTDGSSCSLPYPSLPTSPSQPPSHARPCIFPHTQFCLSCPPLSPPPTQVLYSTPPRFPPAILASLRASATRLFSSLSLRDCARLDGWFLPPSSPAYTRVLAGLRASSRLRGGSKGENDEGDKEAANNEDNQEGEEEWEEEYKEGIVVFSDVNIVSGMEQTSFLFQQAALIQPTPVQYGLSQRNPSSFLSSPHTHSAQVGLSHSLIFRSASPTPSSSDTAFPYLLCSKSAQTTLFPLSPNPTTPQVGLSHSLILRWILASACSRYDLPLPLNPSPASPAVEREGEEGGGGEAGVSGGGRQLVWVLFGGSTAERQVSLISGTNVWLKLRACPQPLAFPLSHDLCPPFSVPHLLACGSMGKRSSCLSHGSLMAEWGSMGKRQPHSPVSLTAATATRLEE
ncbi:unnamed protein product [Closterium sp. NIES-53]